MNGILSVPGVAVAHHRQTHEAVKAQAEQAWALLVQLQANREFPLKVEIDNSRIVHIYANGQDLAERIEEYTNKKLELVLTEMAFSTNSGILADGIDWLQNSQLNEGTVGIHVGLGDGLTGAHIDLICPNVALQI